jgi:hypothetical protein
MRRDVPVCLLDVNVLIALAWPSHVHHRPAHAWFARRASGSWATCPLTQTAFVRVSATPAIVSEAVTPKQALEAMSRITALRGHQFWPDDLPAADCTAIASGAVSGHRQVTDAYLVALARHHGGRLATLDRRIAALCADTPEVLEMVLA